MSNAQKVSDLLPCPFCGAPGKMIHPMAHWMSKEIGYGPDGSRITCSDVGCTGCGKACYGEDQDAQAIAAWNTRAAPTPDAHSAVGVKALEWVQDGPNNWRADCEFGPYSSWCIDGHSFYRRPYKRSGGTAAGSTIVEAQAAAQADFAQRVRSCLPAGSGGVFEAARNLIASRSSTFKARNGRDVGIQDDSGEKMWIVPFDEMLELEAALTAGVVKAEPVAWTNQDGLDYLKKGYGIDVSAVKGTMDRNVGLYAALASKPEGER